MRFVGTLQIKMKNVISFKNWITSIAGLLFIIPYCHSINKVFICPTMGAFMPDFPQAYSTNVRINYESELRTVEVKQAVNAKERKQLVEFKMPDRRVKYIQRGDQKSMLIITYKNDERPTCVVKNVSAANYFEEGEAGPSNILNKIDLALLQTDKFRNAGPDFVDSVYGQRFEGCFSNPKINVSFSFSVPTWNNSHRSSLNKNVSYPVVAEAQIDGVYMTAVFSKFDPTEPDDALFQPTPDVYCEGFRADKAPPNILDYFSFDAEVIVYQSAVGIAPIVSHKKVYYDYPARISRIDFYDPLAEDSDMFSPISAQEKSVIHDFNAGIQYSFDPFTGKCTIDTFEVTNSIISNVNTNNGTMLKGNDFFWLNSTKISYNGQFPVRGMMADVYTAIKEDLQNKKNSLVSWYFSTKETRIVETETVEKNVLLRMTVRPETDIDQEGVTIIHIYNFASEEPSFLKYDITTCYNDSNSRILVLTFPGNDLLRGSEKLIGVLVHLALQNVTGVSKQRLVVREVVFSGNFIYAEFELLDVPPSLGKVQKQPDLKISLDDALNKIRSSISLGTFTVKVPAGAQIIILRPEPDGLNVFAGDRVRKPPVTGYKEGSVISLTVGMLFLGFLLGGVTINLVMSRKFGVSLFQKGKYGNKPYGDDSLGESSM